MAGCGGEMLSGDPTHLHLLGDGIPVDDKQR